MKTPKLKMVEKGGKKVPAFAADGIGKMAVGGLVGALMNKDKPGGMLGGIIPGVAGMLVRDRAKKDKEAAAKKAKPVQKKAMGGKCRGMGAATKGGNYKG